VTIKANDGKPIVIDADFNRWLEASIMAVMRVSGDDIHPPSKMVGACSMCGNSTHLPRRNVSYFTISWGEVGYGSACVTAEEGNFPLGSVRNQKIASAADW
jgi:hypothetical protein